MSSDQAASGSTGNAPVYLIVSAPAPASITGENKDAITGQSLQQPTQNQPQHQTLSSSNISQTRTTNLSNLDLNSSTCNVGAIATSVPQVSHQQVAYINQSNNIKPTPKAQVTENVTLHPSILQQIQALQKGVLPTHQQVVGMTSQNATVTQAVPASVSQSSSGHLTNSITNNCSNETINNQLITILSALQQRQQQQQTQHSDVLTANQQHIQMPQQQVIFQNSSGKDSSPANSGHPGHLIQSQQGHQVPNSSQQLFQPNQDMGQVLQAVLSHTAAMQGNLTTILTTLSNLMRQQQNQQHDVLQKPEQLQQSAGNLIGHQVPMGLQTMIKPSAQVLSHSSSIPQASEASDCSGLNQAVFKQTSSAGSCTVTSTQSGIFSGGIVSKSQSQMTQPTLIQGQATDDCKLTCEASGTLSSLPQNFSESLNTESSDQPMSQTPPVSLPMDVDALLQQILGETFCQKPDPTLASVKLDVPDTEPSQPVPMQTNTLNQQQFVDSLLNQTQSPQGEVKSTLVVDRQNNTACTAGNTSTLRSLLTESSWLNVMNKSSDDGATPTTSISSSTEIFGQSVTGAANTTFISSDGKSNVTELQQAIPQQMNIHKESDDNRHESPLLQQTELRDSVPDRFDQSSQQPQPQHNPQSQILNINFDIASNTQRPESHMPTSLVSNINEDQSSNLGILGSRTDMSMDYDSSLTIPLSNVRQKNDDGESSGGEDSSPSCSSDSSRCGSPIPSRNSPTDFMNTDLIYQDSDTQMSVIRRCHDMHLGSCSDSAVDDASSTAISTTTTTGMPNVQMLNSQFSGVQSVVSVVRSSAQSTVGDESQTGLEDDDDDEMEPAAKQRRGINQAHVSDFCTTDEESNHGNLATSTWSSPSAASSPPPVLVNQTPRLSGSGASLIMPTSVAASDHPPAHHRKIPRLPSLSNPFEPRQGPVDLRIIVQPEEQHRARYMTEGSRGAVKDRSGQGHPVVQLFGWRQAATLQVFVGTDQGRVKPHGFYQACKVSGKNSTPCKERNFDGTNVIEIQFDPQKDMKLSIDCVGILKLRNADVEQRIGLHKTKKSTKARLVFRVNLPRGDGSFITVQTFTDPIVCTQPIGSPEISRISAVEASCHGGLDLFIIGKNFARGTKVIFQEISNDGKEFPVWEMEAEIETEHLGQSHLICKVPPYCSSTIISPVTVQMIIQCNGRSSEPHIFTYKPAILSGDQRAWDSILSVATSLSRTSSQDGRNSTQPNTPAAETFVSPVAVELNKLVQVKPSPSIAGGASGDFLTSPVGTTLPFSGSPVVAKDSPPVSEPLSAVRDGGEAANTSPSHQRRLPEQMDWAKIEIPISNSSGNDCYFLTDLTANQTTGTSGQTGKGSLPAPGSNPDTFYIP